MSVANQERPAVARFARWLLGCAVRHWPEENRAWGLALAALDELAARAEKERDASTLAFVALSTSDRAHGADLAARAVALDPQFMWVFAARNRGLDDDPPRAEWLARLLAADPGNAVPQLLVADAQVQARIETDLEREVKIDKIRQRLESDSNWLVLMDSAYAAPRYDSYFQRHFTDLRACRWATTGY